MEKTLLADALFLSREYISFAAAFERESLARSNRKRIQYADNFLPNAFLKSNSNLLLSLSLKTARDAFRTRKPYAQGGYKNNNKKKHNKWLFFEDSKTRRHFLWSTMIEPLSGSGEVQA